MYRMDIFTCISTSYQEWKTLLYNHINGNNLELQRQPEWDWKHMYESRQHSNCCCAWLAGLGWYCPSSLERCCRNHSWLVLRVDWCKRCYPESIYREGLSPELVLGCTKPYINGWTGILSLCDFPSVAVWEWSWASVYLEGSKKLEREWWWMVYCLQLEELKAVIQGMAAQSLRCIAFAYCPIEGTNVPASEEEGAEWQQPDENLILLAICGIKVHYYPFKQVSEYWESPSYVCFWDNDSLPCTCPSQYKVFPNSRQALLTLLLTCPRPCEKLIRVMPSAV